jgi:DNA repair protein RadC
MVRLANLPTADAPCADAGPVARLIPLFAAYVGGGTIERAALAGFDRHGRLRSFAEIAGNAEAIADILPTIRSVLAESSVTELVLAHNHPAASSTPSPRDRMTTDRLAALSRLAGAMLVDHLIFGSDGIFSMMSGRQIGANAQGAI